MRNKKVFGLLTSAALLLNGAPLSVIAEEMVETGPSGNLPGATTSNVALTSENFPDNNLLTAIKNQNGTATKASDVTILDVPQSVQSLEGLEYLTGLKGFRMVGNNNVTSVDLSNCTSLQGDMGDTNYPDNRSGDPIWITANGVLTSIALPEDDDVTAITITQNPSLDEIDLSTLALLEDATLYSNSLDTLDLSGNVYLQTLNVSGNELYQLDATPCKQLSNLNVENNKIYEMKVSTAIPTALQLLSAGRNKLQEFDASELKGLKSLDLNNNMLKSVKLGSQSFTVLNLSYNHLASLNLKKVDLQNAQLCQVSPQILYANATDKAVNLKEYDPNFDPDKALDQGKNPFNDDGIYDIPGQKPVNTLTSIDDENTQIVISQDENGTTIKLLINGSEVNTDDFDFDPSIDDLETMDIADATKATVTVTPKEDNKNYIGEATVTPVVDEDLTQITEDDIKVTGFTSAPESESGLIRENNEDEEVDSVQEEDVAYNAEAWTPVVEVTVGGTKLVEDTDYTLTVKNNVNAGEATYTIAGKGKYYGNVTETFEIKAATPKAEDITFKATANREGSTVLVNFVSPSVAFDEDSIDLSDSQFTLTDIKTGSLTLSPDSNSSTNFTGSPYTDAEWINDGNALKVSGTLNLNVDNNIIGKYTFTDVGIASSETEISLEDSSKAESTSITSTPGGATTGISNKKSFYTYNTANNTLPTMIVDIVKEDLMNRLYNPNSGEHFYTKDTHEKDVLVSLGWQYEGTGWVSPIESSTPIYRLYNANAGDHHYTADVNEKDTLVRVGWSYEGIGWYGANSGNNKVGTGPITDITNLDNTLWVNGIEVFREYNPNAKAAGAHNYTINEIENEVLTSIGWLDEGIAWWALK